MAANYNCLLFDIDGTLLDFEAAERSSIHAVLQEFSLPADDATAALFSRINAELWAALEKREIKKEKVVVERFRLLLEQLGKQGNPEEINTAYLQKLAVSTQIFPGVKEMLAELAEFATMAVISNGMHKVQISRLEKSGLLPYFDEVFVSEKVGCTKPAPKFFEYTLQQLGVKNKEKVLVIGDSLTADIKGGNSFGLDTCWCNYNNIENETGIEPTYTVNSIDEIKLIAVGKEELELAATREKRHTAL